MKKKGLEVKVRSVDNTPETRHAENLADCGMAIDVICHETGLTRGAVRYRLGKKGKKVTDYRNGTSALGKFVKRRVYEMTHKEIKDLILKRLHA